MLFLISSPVKNAGKFYRKIFTLRHSGAARGGCWARCRPRPLATGLQKVPSGPPSAAFRCASGWHGTFRVCSSLGATFCPSRLESAAFRARPAGPVAAPRRLTTYRCPRVCLPAVPAPWPLAFAFVVIVLPAPPSRTHAASCLAVGGSVPDPTARVRHHVQVGEVLTPHCRSLMLPCAAFRRSAQLINVCGGRS